MGLPTYNPHFWEAEAGVSPVSCLGIPLLTKVEMGAGRGSLPVLYWAAFIVLHVSQQGAEVAGRWEQQQEVPSGNRPYTSMGPRASWVGSESFSVLTSAVALGPGEALVSKDTTAP